MVAAPSYLSHMPLFNLCNSAAPRGTRRKKVALKTACVVPRRDK
jgi:hypothetical protein